MKKIIAVASAFSLAAGMAVAANAADFLGDIDKNGVVNSSDALTILEYSIGKTTEIDSKIADMDKDGNINSGDALLVLRTSVGELELQTVEEEEEPDTELHFYTNEDVLNFYNDSMNSAYAKNVTVKKTQTVNITVEEVTGGKTVENLLNNTLIPKFAGTKELENSFKDGIAQDGTKITEFVSPAGLTVEGIASAKAEKVGENYEVEIVVIPESSTVSKLPKYNSLCAHPLDLSKVDVSPAKITTADFNYPGTVLKATVDSKGKLLNASIDMPLNGSGKGTAFFVSMSAKLSGSFEQNCTFTY